MKISRSTLFLTLFLLFIGTAAGQNATETKPSEDAEKLKKEAVVFLRETMADVNNLRTLENRISFSAELASLMWFSDEREAKSMYQTAINDFKELVMRFDGQMNAFGMEEGSTYSGGLFVEATDRSVVSRKFQIAMQVRQQIAMSLAEHDPEMAFSFYNDSLQVLTNPEFRKQMENRDSYFEVQLMTQIAKTNAAKATQFAIKSIDKGVGYQHLELLRKIYEKDAEKGAEFGVAMLGKLKSDKQVSEKLWVMSSLLDFGGTTLEKSQKEGGKKPVYSQQELRDLAEILAQTILNNNDEDGSSGLQYADNIEKYLPGRATQIRSKFRVKTTAGSSQYSNSAVKVSGVGYGSGSATNSNSGASNGAAQREREEREKTEQELRDGVEKLKSGQLPKEEREKIIEQARKLLMQTPGRDKKILGISSLAAQVARMGDKELAAEIMRDAQNLVNPQPKNYQDYMMTWMLISGYAEADPDKAFPLLEDTIYRLNDTIGAFVKVAEFIDRSDEMIQDGEVQVGVFGGSMIRGLTSELGLADITIKSLARSDFVKTKNLANRFDRSEVRILAKMMILRSVLDEKKESKDKETEMDVLTAPQVSKIN